MPEGREIWILGGAGRTGRAIAAELVARKQSLVLVGRDRARLLESAAALGDPPRVAVAGSLDAMVAELARSAPAVVVNTIGPFVRTALPIARACPPGTHCVDLANELPAVTQLLDSHGEAAASGRCLVTGAGFGVLGTESVVLKLCAGEPPAARVRVDAVPYIAGSDALGPTLAATVVEGLAAGGRRLENGALVRTRLGGDVERLRLPDGSTAVTAAIATGELEAARRASRAPFVVSASSEAPTTPLARIAMSGLGALVSWRATRGAIERRLARFRLPPPVTPREFSWTRARVEWPDGRVREGWLRAPEGMAFTAKVAAEVAARLAGGGGRPGAYTPGGLLGPGLAEQAGGQFTLGPAR